MRRRDFLRTSTSVLGATSFWRAKGAQSGPARQPIALAVDLSIAATSRPGVRWALSELKKSLEASGFSIVTSQVTPAGAPSIVISGPSSPSTRLRLEHARLPVPNTPESFVLVETVTRSGTVLLACGADERGIAYALGEIAERLRDPAAEAAPPALKSPANAVRSVMRQFTSELLDKRWFYDRESWQHYLDLLATNRWNRLDLTFGLGYDFLKRVDDSYFLFLYPFLIDVPGYRVQVTNLPGAERDRNLETLQFIGEQTVARGMDFQLGIWMHGYQWDAGRARYLIKGITPENHAPYCRDALALLLKTCPSISSVGLRIHGESGIAEGSYDFWSTIFDGVKRCGRQVEIDLHAKGIDERMIANAVSTGMPVNVSAKYAAEHFAMPYHQASIREKEMPVSGHVGAGLMSLSEGARVFTRYGYADLLKEDRAYSVRYRVFAGTQRILLSNDPVWTATYASAFQFCGAKGVDFMEPLTYRGRRGSAVQGARTGYADARLEPKWDWEKYAPWYRTWGRLLYDPRDKSILSQRSALDRALAAASRILPIVTNAHLPSAACDAYWPEIYWNQPMAAEPAENPYSDTFAPKVFHNASPLDPQLFATMNEFVEDLLAGKRRAKYSPMDVAAWLDAFAAEAETQLGLAPASDSPASQRAIVDTKLQIGLGRFFAAKFRAGVLYALYEKTNDRGALDACLEQYRAARGFWAEVARVGGQAYAADLSISNRFDERGQWRDRLAGIDSDIAALTQKLAFAKWDPTAARLIDQLLRPEAPPRLQCQHEPPAQFRRGESVSLTIGIDGPVHVAAATLLYRRVNQAERFQSMVMESDSGRLRAQIAASYSDSPYPLQYYFELQLSPTSVVLYPGFTSDLTNQPYYVVRQQPNKPQ